MVEKLDLSPFLTQAAKTQNPFKGELSHGVVETDMRALEVIIESPVGVAKSRRLSGEDV